MSLKENTYVFQDWFSLDLPENWEFEREEQILNIYSTVKPKGVLQISFFINEEKGSLDDVAKLHLDNFISQFEIEIDINTYTTIESPDFVVATVCGSHKNSFIKIWIIVNSEKLLLVTYNSTKKSRELSKVDDIVYSVDFNNII